MDKLKGVDIVENVIEVFKKIRIIKTKYKQLIIILVSIIMM